MTTTLTPQVDIRRSGKRYHTDFGWLNSQHSFSFGHHYDRTNTHHGLLLVSNDDKVAAGTGFDTHPHRDMEIVTWVLSGSLVHKDSEGNSGILYPNLAQRMSAGTGILHSEKNDSWTLGGAPHDTPVHFVQMWVVPDTAAITPEYEQLELNPDDLAGKWGVVASGLERHTEDRAIRIRNRYAAFQVARLQAGDTVNLPEAPYLHVFMPYGLVDFEGHGTLSPGDAVRCTGSGGQRITAYEPTELLLWEMHATIA
jgi:redox-sensitive bicupin YhaK (pirin superfamily)